MTQIIVVLNDGETFSDIVGCTIREAPDGLDTDQIEQALAEDTLPKKELSK